MVSIYSTKTTIRTNEPARVTAKLGRRYFSMFTDAGNSAVRVIVMDAIDDKWSRVDLMDALYELAETTNYTEATDTAVRESAIETVRYFLGAGWGRC